MKINKILALIALALSLGFAGFEAAAEPHFCAAHCSSHTDPDAKMCMNHCSTGMAEEHDCAVHCKNLPADDQDEACAAHCSK